MRRFLGVCVFAVAVFGAPLAASAQTALADDDRAGLISAGAYIGMEFDQPDDWLIFGADARVQIAHSLEIEPRFMYRPLNAGHIYQFDANVLKNFDLARPGRVRPFMGVGGTIRTDSPDNAEGNTDVGLNIISGLRFAMSSSAGYEPFVVGQYSIVHEQANAYSLVVGVSFRLRH